MTIIAATAIVPTCQEKWCSQITSSGKSVASSGGNTIGAPSASCATSPASESAAESQYINLDFVMAKL